MLNLDQGRKITSDQVLGSSNLPVNSNHKNKLNFKISFETFSFTKTFSCQRGLLFVHKKFQIWDEQIKINLYELNLSEDLTRDRDS